MRKVLITLPLVTLLLFAALGGAIAFGGPGEPAPMTSINDPFKGIDYSELPALSRYSARDGAALAYRVYAPQGMPRGSVVLVHRFVGQQSQPARARSRRLPNPA